MAISGHHAIVGADLEDEDASGQNTLSGAGSAYIFERDTGTGNWREVQKIVASDRAIRDNFGVSVAISGHYVTVGALREDEDASGQNTLSGAGSAYIFSFFLDTSPPTRRTGTETVFLDKDGLGRIFSEKLDRGTFDNVLVDTFYTIPDTVRCADRGQFTVTFYATDSVGNIDRQEVTITVRDTIPPVLSLPGDTSVCVEDPAALNFNFDITTDDNCEAELEIIRENLDNLEGNGVRNYQVYRAVDPAGNVTRDSFFVQITQALSANFTVDTLDSLAIALEAEIQDLEFYRWDFGDNSQLEAGPVLEHTYASGGQYQVTLQAGVSENCQREVTREVTVVQETGYCQVPQAFSPNGDELNDLWEIRCQDVSNITWQVYDRWGRLQAEGEGTEEGFGWEGRGQDGQILEDGVYLYEVCWLQEDELGRSFNFCDKGLLHLIR